MLSVFASHHAQKLVVTGVILRGKSIFHLLLHELKPLKSPCLVFHTQAHTDGSMRGTAGLGRLEGKQGVLMKRVLQFNCSGCAFVCAKK